MIANKQATFISNQQKNHINKQENNQRQKEENLQDLEKDRDKLPIGNNNNNNNHHHHHHHHQHTTKSRQPADEEPNLSEQSKQQNATETTSETKTKTTQSVMQTKKQHQYQSGTGNRRPNEDSCGPHSETKLSEGLVANATSLTTASVKIQQRQQKFLAAAAKSHQKRPASGNANESAWRTPLLPLLARVNESRFSDKSPLNQAAAVSRSAAAAATTTTAATDAVSVVVPVATSPANNADRCRSLAIKDKQHNHHHQHHNEKSSSSSSSQQETPSVTSDGQQQAFSNNSVSSVGSGVGGSEPAAARLAPTDAGRDVGGPKRHQPLPSGASKLSPRVGASLTAAMVTAAAATTTTTTATATATAAATTAKATVASTTSGGHDLGCIGNNINILCSNNNNNNNFNNNIIINNHHYNQYNNHLQYYHHQQQHQHQHQHQPTQAQHQNVMAHYKFHNDCQSSVLTYEQVKRLDFVMDQTVPIHGRGNSPTLYVKLKELIRLVKYKLQHEHSIEIRDVRLNGGAASYVLAPENSHYNDLDLIFGTDLSEEDRFDVIRDVVLECLKEFAPDRTHRQANETTKKTSMAVNNNNNNIKESNETAKKNCCSDYDTNENGTDDDLTESSRSNRSSLSLESDSMNITLANGSDDGTDDNASSCDDEKSSYDISGCELSRESDDFKQQQQQQQHDRVPKIEGKWKKNDVAPKRQGGCDYSLANKFTRHNSEADGSLNVQQSSQVTMSSNDLINHSYQMPLSNCAIKEAYVHKMVKVNDDDRWSLISLGVQQSEANCCNQQQVQQQRLINRQECGQTQSPNSIELKFVDRMRRKFEFSVDSFQIILDSLIQFYDYAPQSTITIQRKLVSSHPSSTMINTRPMLGSRDCRACCHYPAICSSSSSRQNNRIDCKTNDQDNYDVSFQDHETYEKNTQDYQDDMNHFLKGENGHNHHLNHDHHHRHKHSNGQEQRHHDSRCSQGYYQLPTSSPSNSSVASSSGCSSSSSVVSSSSSSLSCDEDQEDLYCDADSAPSSSASTSSLLSSTTMSMMSSSASSCVSPCNVVVGMKTPSAQQQKGSAGACVKQKNLKSKENSKAPNGSLPALTSATATTSTEANATTTTTTTTCSRDHQTNKQSAKHELIGAGRSADCGVGDSGSGSDTNGNINSSNQQLVAANNNNKNLRDLRRSGETSCAVISENFYPTVIGRSEYGNFKEALFHLEKKLIATRSPEEIRGGGLLKYCNLLVKNYKPTNVYQIRTLERYMCSRFFIDFSDLNQQRAKLESYLANHFSDDPIQKFDYLTILHNVVQRSTVCLMNHELRLTLGMIRDLAYKLNELQQAQQQQQQQQHQHQGLDHQPQQQQHHHLIAQRQQVQQSHQHHQKQQQKQQISTFQQQPSSPPTPEHKQQHYYQQHEPIVVLSGIYRVKLVNYAMTKPVRS